MRNHIHTLPAVALGPINGVTAAPRVWVGVCGGGRGQGKRGRRAPPNGHRGSGVQGHSGALPLGTKGLKLRLRFPGFLALV